jgi:hypothetical protein
VLTFKFRDGGRKVPGRSADEVCTELERIRALDAQGRLDPQRVVDESRGQQAILHSYFEWDDVVAGAQYRLNQARTLLRVVIEVEEDSAPVARYIRVEQRDYRPVEDVIERVDLFEAALTDLQRKFAIAERAVRELEGAAKRGSSDPDRLAAIALAVQGFETVREAISILR